MKYLAYFLGYYGIVLKILTLIFIFILTYGYNHTFSLDYLLFAIVYLIYFIILNKIIFQEKYYYKVKNIFNIISIIISLIIPLIEYRNLNSVLLNNIIYPIGISSLILQISNKKNNIIA